MALLLLALAFATFAVSCGDSDSTGAGTALPTDSGPTVVPTVPAVVEVRIGDRTILADTAQTAGERSQGLSDRPAMGEEQGMLFLLGIERVPSFSMRRMHFPLDFIWISSDLRVVDLTEDVPDPDSAGETFSGIRPGVPVRFVLEVNAGVIARSGVQVGDDVVFHPDVSGGGIP